MFQGVAPLLSPKFSAILSIPVDFVPGRSPAGPFAQLSAFPLTFSFTLTDVIVAASRFLFCHGSPFLVRPQIVQEWQTILAWELEQFWDIDFVTNSIDSTYARQGIFTTEHATRSGEHIAAGIALLYVDQLQWMSIASCEFYPGTTARPDFVLPIVMPNNQLVGLEARCRAYTATLDYKSEIQKIDAKKRNVSFANILGVYFQYGDQLKRRSPVTKHKSQTRLVLIDPENDVEPQPAFVRKRVILANYGRIFAEIGLHHYSEVVASALDAILSDVDLPHGSTAEWRLRPNGYHPRVRRFGDSDYVGRDFSTLLAAEQFGSRRSFGGTVPASELGSYGFVGVSAEVLKAMHYGEWESVFAFRDPTAYSANRGSSTILSDGYCSDWHPVTPGSAEADDILKSR